MDYGLAFKAFFGMNPDEIGDRIIVTNIQSIYTALINNACSVGIRKRGFYEVTALYLSNKRYYHIIKITPGSSIIDVIKLLTCFCKRLYFVGIAGCLDSSRSLGEVCEPTVFVSPNSICTSKGTVICQTSGLIQTNEFYLKLQRKGVVLLDMECLDVYMICKSNHVPLKYIVQISDFPLDTPFYNVDSQPIQIKQIINLLQDE